MRTEELIQTASNAYADDSIAMADQEGDGAGDTLALFVARELRETHDEAAPEGAALRVAAEKIQFAARQLARVASHLRRKARGE